MDSTLSKASKDFGKYRVEVFADPEKGGQLMIWNKVGEHDLLVVAKSDDREWDCIYARMFSAAKDAEKAYDATTSEEQIDLMIMRCGFGKLCI